MSSLFFRNTFRKYNRIALIGFICFWFVIFTLLVLQDRMLGQDQFIGSLVFVGLIALLYGYATGKYFVDDTYFGFSCLFWETSYPIEKIKRIYLGSDIARNNQVPAFRTNLRFLFVWNSGGMGRPVIVINVQSKSGELWSFIQMAYYRATWQPYKKSLIRCLRVLKLTHPNIIDRTMKELIFK